MRKIDFLILLMCMIGMFLLWQSEDGLKFVKSWKLKYNYFPFSSNISPMIIENGKGEKEVVISDRNFLKIFSLKGLNYQPMYVRENFRDLNEQSFIQFKVGDMNIRIVSASYNQKKKEFILFLSNFKLIKLRYISCERLESNFEVSLEEFSEIDQKIVNAKILILNQLEIHSKDEGVFILIFQTDDGHYNYYGLDLVKGETRWSHTKESYHFEMEKADSHKLKLNKDLEHYGEYDWNIFRYDLLKHFPHSFRHKNDLKIKVDCFKPYRRITDVPRREIKRCRDPNVLVVHNSKGIEVIHLYTGRTLTQVAPLNHNTLYDDINCDDSIESVKVSSNENCFIDVETGIPDHEESIDYGDVFKKISVCKQYGALNFLLQNEVLQKYRIRGDLNIDNTNIPVAPIVVKDSESQSNIIFYANNGLISSVKIKSELDGSKKLLLNWQTETPVSFHEVEDNFFEVTSFDLRVNGIGNSFIAASGDNRIVILNPNGKIQQIIQVEEKKSTSSPLIFESYSGSSYNDLIFVCEDVIFAYSSRVGFGSNVLSFLILSFLVVIFLMYISTQIQLKDPLYKKSY